MNPLNHFIISLPKKHKDSLKVGGREIFLDSKFHEFEHRISHAKIIGVPIKHDTGAEVGDTLFFHHHVAMSEMYALGDGKFWVQYNPTETMASHAISYRSKKTGKLNMLGGWVFVDPIVIEEKEEVTDSGIILSINVAPTDESRAVVLIPNEALVREGVNTGDVVGFSKNSDYKMTLDDDSVVFRMRYESLVYVETKEKTV